MTDVTIVIVNWNTREDTQQCISSIHDSCQDICYEVIIIDNNSSDGSQDMIREKFPQVELIENDENRGFGPACNQGIEAANGENILLLNSDTTMRDHVLDSCIKFLEDHPDAGGMGCQLRNPDGTIQPSCYKYVTLSQILYKKIFQSSYLPVSIRQWLEPEKTPTSYDEVRAVDYVMGAFLLAPRSIITNVGGFDERFFLYAGEADLCLRLKQNGWVLYYYPEDYIYHSKAQSSEQAAVETEIQKVVSRALFMQKHYSTPHYLTYAILEISFNVANLIVGRLNSQSETSNQIYRGKIIALSRFLAPWTKVKGKAVAKGEVTGRTNIRSR